MIDLLQNDVANAIVAKRSDTLGSFPNRVVVESEVAPQLQFDIKDCKDGESVFCMREDPERAASYINSTEGAVSLRFIKYERFVNQFYLDAARDWSKNIGRADYVVVSDNSDEYVIIHEVSRGKIGSKESKGKQQIHSVLKLFNEVAGMKNRIDSFRNKLCYISAAGCDDFNTATPQGVADPFMMPYGHMPNPKPIKYQPIEKLNFRLFSGNIVEIK